MNKRLIVILATVASAMVLITGCGCKHEWADATCQAPQTCKICGKTQGEVGDHVWQDATCAAPKTCSVCGTTEGEALAHTPGEAANYQQAQVCTVCGAEIAPKITAAFEEKGLVAHIDSKLDEPIYVHYVGYEDDNVDVDATMTYSNYRCVYENPNLNLEGKEGYVWVLVDEESAVDDPDAYYGFRGCHTCIEDYYDIVGHDDSVVEIENPNFINACTYTCHWNGQDYECERRTTGMDSWEWIGDYMAIYSKTLYLHVPEGYDGIVVGVFEERFDEWTDGTYVFDYADEYKVHMVRLPAANITVGAEATDTEATNSEGDV